MYDPCCGQVSDAPQAEMSTAWSTEVSTGFPFTKVSTGFPLSGGSHAEILDVPVDFALWFITKVPTGFPLSGGSHADLRSGKPVETSVDQAVFHSII